VLADGLDAARPQQRELPPSRHALLSAAAALADARDEIGVPREHESLRVEPSRALLLGH
jgi:hypothetical protein